MTQHPTRYTKHPYIFDVFEIGSVAPLDVSVVPGWPPDWSSVRGSAFSLKPYSALLRLWRYALFISHVQVHEKLVDNCMDGCMDECVHDGGLPPAVRCGRWAGGLPPAVRCGRWTGGLPPAVRRGRWTGSSDEQESGTHISHLKRVHLPSDQPTQHRCGLRHGVYPKWVGSCRTQGLSRVGWVVSDTGYIPSGMGHVGHRVYPEWDGSCRT
eukprot:363067-Chlamydomonas_euryale.AAC.4